jgi:hypothetical protein
MFLAEGKKLVRNLRVSTYRTDVVSQNIALSCRLATTTGSPVGTGTPHADERVAPLLGISTEKCEYEFLN